MKRLILTDLERKFILNKHKSAIREQSEPKNEAQQVIDNFMKLKFTDDGSSVFEEDFGDLTFMYEDDMGGGSVGISFKLDPSKTKFKQGKIGFTNLDDNMNQKLGTLVNELQMASIPYQTLKSQDNLNVNLLFGPMEPNVRFEQVLTNFIKSVKGDITLE